MSKSGKTVSVILLAYFLFGLFNFFQFSTFVVPVLHHEILVFLIVLLVFLQHIRELEKKDFLLFIYALTGMLTHPFIWELMLTQHQIHQLLNHIAVDVVRILGVLSLVSYFVLIGYDALKHLLRLEWLVVAAVSAGLLFNPPMWYYSLVFGLSGLFAYYTIVRRKEEPNYRLNTLIGIGILYAINLFFWV